MSLTSSGSCDEVYQLKWQEFGQQWIGGAGKGQVGKGQGALVRPSQFRVVRSSVE